MIIPTESSGSIPRPLPLIEALKKTDDCRETAFVKIRARILGTALAGKMIGGS